MFLLRPLAALSLPARGAVVGVAVAVALVVVTIASVLGAIGAMRELSGAMTQAQARLDQLAALDYELRAAADAQHALADTGSETHILSFNHAKSGVFATWSELRRLAAGDPERLEETDALVSASREFLKALQSALTPSAGGPADQALASEALMASFEQRRAALHTKERQELARLRESVIDGVSHLRLVATSGTMLAVGVLALCVVLIWVDGMQRGQAQQELVRLGDVERQNVDRVARLAEFGQLLHSCHSPDEIYGVVTAAASDLFGASGTLYRLRASADAFEQAADWGLGGPDVFRREGCWAIRRGRSHVSGPGHIVPRCDHLTDTKAATRCQPLVNYGETIGLLVLEAADESLDHRRIAAAAAEQLASALGSIETRERLRAQSIRDELTGLYNRRFFEEALERELHRAGRLGKPLSLLFFDIDHFKRFNDTWGHEGGDAVLRELGGLVRSMFRTEDCGCRYGGEEFVLILIDAGLENARAKADQLRSAVHQLRVRFRHQLLDPVTLSVGVACTTEQGLTGSALIAAADEALYAAKRAGRDRVECAEAAAGACPPGPDDLPAPLARTA